MTWIRTYYCRPTLIQRRKLIGGFLVVCASTIASIVGFIQQHRRLGIASGLCGLFASAVTAWLVQCDLYKADSTDVELKDRSNLSPRLAEEEISEGVGEILGDANLAIPTAEERFWMAARREESVGMRADETGATSGRTLEVPNSRKIQRRVLARDIPSDNDKSKFRISLNNLLKYRGQAEKLSWKEIQTGPHHSPVWTVTAYMEDEWYVSGTGITRSDAKEAASREALARMFSWESEFTGPPHAPLWTAIAILDDVMYAQGSGRSRQAARKVATDVALANVVVKYGPSP